MGSLSSLFELYLQGVFPPLSNTFAIFGELGANTPTIVQNVNFINSVSDLKPGCYESILEQSSYCTRSGLRTKVTLLLCRSDEDDILYMTKVTRDARLRPINTLRLFNRFTQYTMP